MMNNFQRKEAKDMSNEKENAVTSYSKTTRTKGSKGGKFNVVDFFLLLIILAVIAALVIYIVPGLSEGLLSGDENEITLELEFKGVSDEFIANINVGDTVYDLNKSYMIGTVKAVESYAYTVPVYNEETGAAEMKEVAGKSNIIVTVSATAVYTSKEGYSINGERVAVGLPYNIGFPQFSGSGYCISVSASTN